MKCLTLGFKIKLIITNILPLPQRDWLLYACYPSLPFSWIVLRTEHNHVAVFSNMTHSHSMYKVINSHGIPFFYNRFEGRICECCHQTISISTLLSGIMLGILRFISLIYRLEKLFLGLLFAVLVCCCLILRFCWL